MSEEAKIHLSAFETELVNNTQWIFTKRIIIEKVYHLLGLVQNKYKKVLANDTNLPSHLFKRKGGKISRGENYNGLPYLILDYPAAFSKEGIFAVRTMFWWGNFFSISLHLSGRYFEHKKDINERLVFLAERNFSVCTSENEWEHHFSGYNFTNANDLSDQQIAAIKKRLFFKTGKNIELNRWESAPRFLEKTFEEIIEFIKLSCPGDEIVL